MLCWSWVFGCKMLNLPKGASGNDSTEVFYACITPLGVCSMEEKSLLKFNCLSCFSHSLFSQTFITNKLKGCLCPVGGVRIRALAVKADNPALQSWQEMSNSFIHKNNFTFLWRGSLLSLLLLCLYHFSAGVPDLQRSDRGRAEGWGRILRTLEERVTRTFHAQGVTVLTELKSRSPPLLLPDLPSSLSAWWRHPSFMVLPYSRVKYLQDLLHY